MKKMPLAIRLALLAIALVATGCLDLDDYIMQGDAGADAADAADAADGDAGD
jgi:hypothetical protein